MNNYKKVELHLHLDGSLRIETILELGKELNILPLSDSINDVKSRVSINKNDKTLVDYLKKFDLPISILQTKDALERVSFELVEDLALENTIYAEIRVAPIFHLDNGLTPNEVVESILGGMQRAQKKYPIKVNLLLCAMRHLPSKENYFLLDLAEKHKNRGVVGLDLAGDEAGFPVTLFEDFFLEAKSRNIPFTIHAGEARGYQSIIDSINIGAKRLGHGIRAYEDERTMGLIRDKGICLECCPKSNYDTNATDDFSKYPIIDYLNSGIITTLSSDNRTVSDTNFTKEVELLNKYITITDSDIKKLNINAINSAFISKETKLELLEVLDRR